MVNLRNFHHTKTSFITQLQHFHRKAHFKNSQQFEMSFRTLQRFLLITHRATSFQFTRHVSFPRCWDDFFFSLFLLPALNLIYSLLHRWTSKDFILQEILLDSIVTLSFVFLQAHDTIFDFEGKIQNKSSFFELWTFLLDFSV